MSGLLNKAVATGEIQEVGVIPGSNGAYAMLNILAVNRQGTEAPLEIWLSSNATPADVDLVEPGARIPSSGGSYEMVGRVVSAGERVFIRSLSGVVVRLETIEEQ